MKISTDYLIGSSINNGITPNDHLNHFQFRHGWKKTTFRIQLSPWTGHVQTKADLTSIFLVSVKIWQRDLNGRIISRVGMFGLYFRPSSPNPLKHEIEIICCPFRNKETNVSNSVNHADFKPTTATGTRISLWTPSPFTLRACCGGMYIVDISSHKIVTCFRMSFIDLVTTLSQSTHTHTYTASIPVLACAQILWPHEDRSNNELSIAVFVYFCYCCYCSHCRDNPPDKSVPTFESLRPQCGSYWLCRSLLAGVRRCISDRVFSHWWSTPSCTTSYLYVCKHGRLR